MQMNELKTFINDDQNESNKHFAAKILSKVINKHIVT